MAILFLSMTLLMAAQAGIICIMHRGLCRREWQMERSRTVRFMLAFVTVVLGGITLLATACVHSGSLHPEALVVLMVLWVDFTWAGACWVWLDLCDLDREVAGYRGDLREMTRMMERERERGIGSVPSEPED